MNVRRWMTVIGVLLALGMLNWCGYGRWRATHGAQASLEAAIAAIRDHDSAAFEKSVDVERLVGSYYDHHLAQKAVDDAVRLREIRAISRRLRHWIDSGETEPSAPHFDALVEFLKEAAASDDRWSTGLVKPTGTTARADVSLHNAEGEQATLELKVVEIDGRWRVAELLNAEQAVNEVRTAEARRVDRQRSQLARVLDVSPALPTPDPAVWRVVLTSRSGDRVDTLECLAQPRGGGESRAVRLLSAPLKPGETRTVTFDWIPCDGALKCLPLLIPQRAVIGERVVLAPARPLD